MAFLDYLSSSGKQRIHHIETITRAITFYDQETTKYEEERRVMEKLLLQKQYLARSLGIQEGEDC